LADGWWRRSVIAGALALPHARAFANDPDPDPGARFVGYKILVVVRAGARVIVSIPSEHRRDASLDYAYGTAAGPRRTPPVKLSDGVASVAFEACPSGTRPFTRRHPLGRETQFNGGVVTRWGRCLPLDVWVRGRDQPIRRVISFGAGECAARPGARGVRERRGDFSTYTGEK
jgi:hypothetical protein